MTQELLQDESKKLKDIIAASVLDFKYKTGIVPGVEIKVVQTFNGCHEVTSQVVVTINIQL